MRIVTLIENTPGAPGCAHEHGLSLYVETGRHTLLMDTGATGAFGAASCFSGTNADFGAPHHGHTQVSGRSVKAFPSFASS